MPCLILYELMPKLYNLGLGLGVVAVGIDDHIGIFDLFLYRHLRADAGSRLLLAEPNLLAQATDHYGFRG